MKLTSLALLLVCGLAHGACPAVVPPNKACIQWQASAGWNDGTAYKPGTVVTYTVYQKATLTSQTGSILGTTTNLWLMSGVLPAGSKCFMVTAKVDDPILGTSESLGSNTACKVIRFPGPSDGKIERPTDGSIEPK